MKSSQHILRIPTRTKTKIRTKSLLDHSSPLLFILLVLFLVQINNNSFAFCFIPSQQQSTFLNTIYTKKIIQHDNSISHEHPFNVNVVNNNNNNKHVCSATKKNTRGLVGPISMIYNNNNNYDYDDGIYNDYDIDDDIDDEDDDDIYNDNDKRAIARLTGVEEFGFDIDEDPYKKKRSECWILVVDDEESIRKAVGQFLFDKGYQVTACPDGLSALKVATSKTTTTTTSTSSTTTASSSSLPVTTKIPDCIVSDIRMPGGMDGLELCRKVRSHPLLVEVPIVLLTAKGMTQDRIAGYDSGADAYLSKPFDPDELLAIIDNVIHRHETLNGSNVQVDDLKRDLNEIKYLLLEKGGGGVGTNNGLFVEKTNVFFAPDEREILEYLCQGLMTKEIAGRTLLSTRRVEQLLTRMFRKTGVKNRTELVRWAVSTGNVQL